MLEEAAAREVREEAHVDVRIDALLGAYSEPDQPVIFIAYAGSMVSGTPAAGDEAIEVGLFSPADLPPLAFVHDDRVVKAWHDYRAHRADTTDAPNARRRSGK